MDKEKQIEEIAKALNDCVGYDEWEAREYGEYTVDCDYTARKLYEQGYRKINENEVVISKEKYILANKCYSDTTLKSWKKDDLIELIRILEHNWASVEESLNNQAKNCEILLKQERKETAREILKLLVPDCKSCDENWHNGCLCLQATLTEKIAKHFGVDLGEEK